MNVNLIIPKHLFFVSILTLSACLPDSKQTPEQIGECLFKTLKRLDEATLDEFVSDWTAYEKLNEIARNEQNILSIHTRRKLFDLAEQKWKSRVEGTYYGFLNRGNEFFIEWDKIKFVSFILEPTSAEKCSGHLKFKYLNRSFDVEAEVIYTGEEYIIFEIEDFKEIYS